MNHKTIDKICEVIMDNLRRMSDRTFNNTLKGKLNVGEVSEKDWQDSSFTFEELVENIRKDLQAIIDKHQ